MQTFKIVGVSRNVKTGNIPQTYTDKSSCPTSCGAYNGCYAKQGNTNIHWMKTNKSFDDLIGFVKNLPRKQLWRHNVAGDLMGINETIDEFALELLVKANKGRKGFTYTHKKSNTNALLNANKEGFTINVSCDNEHEVKQFHAMGLPVVTIDNNPAKVSFIANVKFVRCPAEYSDKVDCAKCQLCADSTREYGIKFTPHGVLKSKIIPIQSI